jgi:hypothetical protein
MKPTTFYERAEYIRKKSDRYVTRFFDRLLLEGGKVQYIYLRVNKKQDETGGNRYRKRGWFIKDGTFWGHIGMRIKVEGFVICVNKRFVLDLNTTQDELDKIFKGNAYIKLIGVYDDLMGKC